jgi:hypothetical protein
MGVEEIEVFDVCWIYLAQDRDQSWALLYVWKYVTFLSYLRNY